MASSQAQSLEEEIACWLERIKEKKLWREFRQVSSAQGPEIELEGRKVLLFCSNNYLNLAAEKRLQEMALEAMQKYGFGSGASRYISGNFQLYQKLEEELAAFKGKEAALVFPTGYQANVGVLAALLRPQDLVFSDELNHASLIDGIRLSKARCIVYPHKDVGFIERALREEKGERRWIVTDGIFSMDGDGAPLEKLVELKKKYGVHLYVDDAHGTGVLGEGGKGYVQACGVAQEVDVIMGTFSKALGSLGGFVAASQKIIAFLRNSCRSLIYTTALPAPVLAWNIASLRLLPEKEKERGHLLFLARCAYELLKEDGWQVLFPEAAILPLVLGESEEALRVAGALLEEAIFAPAIRPPTVKEGSARIRFSFMAGHSKEDVNRLVRALRKARK